MINILYWIYDCCIVSNAKRPLLIQESIRNLFESSGHYIATMQKTSSFERGLFDYTWKQWNNGCKILHNYWTIYFTGFESIGCQD
jgi:hypothetical protein